MWKYGMVSDISVDFFSKSHKTWPKRERMKYTAIKKKKKKLYAIKSMSS